ncbi:cation-transporting P-type ATPase [Nonomuraea sp. B12E4]|uniref:cation-transporting P-type ATPase n=1 Tax=Nonomuraea sp. B12E4 TaxID=3153564 RepID=UPI00325D8B1E
MSDAASPRGLSSARARDLLAQVGPNMVPEQRPRLAARIAAKLWAPVPWMLEITIALEVALGKWLEAAVVAVVLAFNAGLSLVQEGRAQAAVGLLRRAPPGAQGPGGTASLSGTATGGPGHRPRRNSSRILLYTSGRSTLG